MATNIKRMAHIHIRPCSCFTFVFGAWSSMPGADCWIFISTIAQKFPEIAALLSCQAGCPLWTESPSKASWWSTANYECYLLFFVFVFFFCCLQKNPRMEVRSNSSCCVPVSFCQGTCLIVGFALKVHGYTLYFCIKKGVYSEWYIRKSVTKYGQRTIIHGRA